MDSLALSGSASYYMQQRGITGTGSGTQSGVHGSPGIHQFTWPNVQYQSSISSTTMGATLPVNPLSGITPHSVNVGTPQAVPSSGSVKCKSGRPRKYGPDGTVSVALTPPASGTHPGTITPTQKRGRGRSPGTGKKQQLSSLGEWLSGSAGMGFTPHVITVAVGEQGPRDVCILSANGSVSTVTLRQPLSSGSTVTYEGQFEILCLSGSYLLTINSDSRNRTSDLSISLASPDGRVIGGDVGGMHIAASTVQVILGSFIWGGSKIKNKKGVKKV